MFIVEIVDRDGVRRFIRVNASNTQEARQIAAGALVGGELVNQVATADNEGLGQLQAQLPPGVSLPALDQIQAFTPTAGGGGGTGFPDDQVQDPSTIGTTGGVGEQLSPFGTFQNLIQGRGINPGSLTGQLLGRQFGATQATQDVGQALGREGFFSGDPNSFSQFANAQGFSGGINPLALSVLRQIGALAPGQGSAEAQPFLTAAPGSRAGGSLQDLARAGVAQRTSGGFAGRFGSQIIEELVSRFGRQQASQTDPNQTFASFLSGGLTG